MHRLGKKTRAVVESSYPGQGTNSPRSPKTPMRVLWDLKFRVVKGINLAVRDTLSSDPYVVVEMGHQKHRTRVVGRNCNPVWDEALTLSVPKPEDTITVTVYDKDFFTADDHMGDADIEMRPYIESVNVSLKNLPEGCAIRRIRPDKNNCLSQESNIIWKNGKITQNMLLKLRNVECGELEVELEWDSSQESKK